MTVRAFVRRLASSSRSIAAALHALSARDAERHREVMDELNARRRVQRAKGRRLRRLRHVAARAAARPGARPPTRERPRCGARCRDGHPCAAPVVWPAGAPKPRRRCRMHGGLSTGPRTAEGRLRSLAAIGRLRAPGRYARILAWDHCEKCVLASRRCRSANAWLLRVGRSPATLARVIRWTRCPHHARRALAILRDCTEVVLELRLPAA